MSFAFFTLLIILSLLAAAFVGIAWVKEPKQTWILPVCLMVVLSAFTTLCYIFLGKPAHVVYQEDDTTLRQIAGFLDNTLPLNAVTEAQIKAELQRQTSRPGAQPTVWLLEGQLALVQKNYVEAKNAYSKAYHYASDDVDIAVSYAQAWYLAEGKLMPDLKTLLQRLEKQHPEQTGLQNLLAVIAYNDKDYARAIRYWQQLLPQYAGDSLELQVLQQAIQNARSQLNNLEGEKNESK